MELEKFKDANKDELSMIEVAHEILHQRGETMAFADLTNEIQVYLGKSDEEIRDRLAQFYTDLNIDGSFISLGDNVWGLRSWYPYDSIDEALVHGEDEEDEERPRKKRKKVNAFLADVSDDDDVIDYDDDDPEDEDLDNDYDDGDDPEDELADGIEGQLTEFSDADLDEENQD
ncbi:DNA-directed RNA polymerase subunit delta [Ligilactobacillus salivarius]|uniref:DNA-directed RNA polymerase subunit delta n=1 Tax=Ligilactobacillus salivarius TaxID=1624 RepID=UPI00136A246B|nr:DNA-directed RNA polymerase subunit delta [Ligilactobacillus salivarius]MYV01579.1 DNA-directed RNA polymerase subunit delta [Ligilactobacillus salivarius]MYY71388.1 DNA-directed RNA polymerase subunit delta [Ligilactobacillus salivarius]